MGVDTAAPFSEGEPMMQKRVYSIIDAPSDLGLRPTGVDQLPDALRAAGLLDCLPGARSGGRVPVPRYSPVRDAATGVLNPDGISAFSVLLADRIGPDLEIGHFPIVLGGDCSILLGSALALRRRGRFGLFFIDGHADFYSPDSEPSGELASMELGVVTGREPAALADLAGLRPLVQEQDVVVIGYRDAEAAHREGSPDVKETEMHVLDLAEVRRLGPAVAARQGLLALEANQLDEFWIHLDADVLHDQVMPAVDYRMPDGLWEGELAEALSTLLASPLAAGLEVTIYNPALDDEDRSAAHTLVRTICDAFSSPAAA
jgi:arginase